MRELGYVIWGSWAVWGLIWGVTWRWSATNAERQPPITRFAHVAVVMLGAACCMATPDPNGVLGRHLFEMTFPVLLAAVAVIVAGHAFSVWARMTLRQNWSWSVTLKEGHELVERGPYRFVRHPIYTGILFALLGTTLARDTLLAWLGFLLIVVGLVLKFRQEEKLLTGHFGPAYTEYAGRVKGLIPFVW